MRALMKQISHWQICLNICINRCLLGFTWWSFTS